MRLYEKMAQCITSDWNDVMTAAAAGVTD